VPKVSGDGFGDATATRATPAARAGTAAIIKVDGRGYRPPGMYAPTESSGRTSWPSSMPLPAGSNHSDGICRSAYARIRAEATLTASTNPSESCPRASSNSEAGTRTVPPVRQSSARACSSRAASPRSRTDSRMGATTLSASDSRLERPQRSASRPSRSRLVNMRSMARVPVRAYEPYTFFGLYVGSSSRVQTRLSSFR
jgi:hypothetical protein